MQDERHPSAPCYPAPHHPSPQALHLLAAMWDGGPTLLPDAVSYNTVIKACANAFQVGRALEVHREMVRRCVCGVCGLVHGGEGGVCVCVRVCVFGWWRGTLAFEMSSKAHMRSGGKGAKRTLLKTLLLTQLEGSSSVHSMSQSAQWPAPTPLAASPRGVKPSVTSFNSLITAASDGGSYDALLEVGLCRRCLSDPLKARSHEGKLLGIAAPACIQLPLHDASGQLPSQAWPATRHWPLRCWPQVGRCLAEADPEVQACVMNTYVAGLVKVGSHAGPGLSMLHK